MALRSNDRADFHRGSTDLLTATTDPPSSGSTSLSIQGFQRGLSEYTTKNCFPRTPYLHSQVMRKENSAHSRHASQRRTKGRRIGTKSQSLHRVRSMSGSRHSPMVKRDSTSRAPRVP